MEETLHQHIESTRDLQRMSGERLHAIVLAQQRQLEELRAYYRWMGFPPPQ
jgi:uncharacterized glyoxalase superfamily metalloenzyme YdcJ